MLRTFFILVAGVALGLAGEAPPNKALIVTGQNNHKWQETTPVLKRLLEETGLFTVDVAISPPQGEDMSGFKPDFASYRVIVLNYNGDSWPPATKEAFEQYMRAGGGMVSYHAANNTFADWKAYNQMLAVSGWGGRTPQFGRSIRFANGKAEIYTPTTHCGHHWKGMPYQITTRDPGHPIMKGLPPVWMHASEELYDSMCGPAENFDVLATAHSDPANQGTDQDEPLMLAVRYGKGRVFHTTLGHGLPAISCVGFITTFQRGTEWAATGKVTQKVPADFPGPDKVSQRK